MSQSEQPPLSILLIEDNPDDVTALRRLLQRAPHVRTELTVVSEFEAATRALAQPFDVCFLDYQLTDYTALELLDRVSARALAGPVILLTGHEDFAVDQAALELGVADYLTKAQLSPPLLDRVIRYSRRHFDDQRQLRRQADHDPLTGLLNRHAFLAQLHGWLAEGTRREQSMYLLYIDLDGFKALNDNWGHDIGDRAMGRVADRLAQRLEPGELMARYGDDEIIAAVTHAGRGTIEDRVAAMLSDARAPLRVDDEELIITVSIGVASAGHAPDDPTELLRLADHAMYAAKRAGRDAFRVYSADLALPPRGRASLEVDLRRALENGDLHMIYQPQLDLTDTHLLGAEALARWTHPTRGPISPGVFVPLAEECGLIRPLTLWSLEAVVAQIEQWSRLLPADFRISVNISPSQLLNPHFPARLNTLLDTHRGVEQWLRLEITESFFLHDSAAEHLAKLGRDKNNRKKSRTNGHGLSLALDDFGTGYSSLSQLARLPIDTLKIDLAFVSHLIDDPRTAALTRAIISIAEDLGMGVIAEGVETEDQATRLIEYGCRQAQGFLYAAGETRDVFQQRLMDYQTADARPRLDS